MARRNPHIEKLAGGYLFPEITRRRVAYEKANHHTKVISLGIGDTTQPLPPFVAGELALAAQGLATLEGYTGYGPEQGWKILRERLAARVYKERFSGEEIFISDGINSDIGRLHLLFGDESTIAVQDPTYPVYVDTSVIHGRAHRFDKESKQYEGITYLPCLEENNFFPDLSKAPRTDIIYFCSPNNPTGAASTRAELTKLVEFAKKNRSIILFDAAYAAYVRDQEVPSSIYEIPGAEEVAIEMGSFSKSAGFTGVRLSWSVVPYGLRYQCGYSIRSDWDRIHCTFFNGASNLAQSGGMAVLTEQGEAEIEKLVDYYLHNAALLRSSLEKIGLEVYGGKSAPFLWVKIPHLTSWGAFQFFLDQAQLVTAPGSGFGPAGENFLRLTAFAHREEIEEACRRIASMTFPIK